MKYLNNYFERMDEKICLLFTLALSLLLGILDFFIGPDLSFSVFYTMPIMLAAWYGGKRIGFIIALVSATIWLGADLAAGSNFVLLILFLRSFSVLLL